MKTTLLDCRLFFSYTRGMSRSILRFFSTHTLTRNFLIDDFNLLGVPPKLFNLLHPIIISLAILSLSRNAQRCHQRMFVGGVPLQGKYVRNKDAAERAQCPQWYAERGLYLKNRTCADHRQYFFL
mmetsp:Transcript_19984/g.59543  ORF Transcript_19984/g.59543 Transcript_19984/m.59543 type:complete len:125 (-) Transcript_19984:1368-1742(-)